MPAESPSLAVSGFALPSLIIFPAIFRCFLPVVSSCSLPHTLQLRLPSCGLQCAPSRPCSMASAGFRFDQTGVGAAFDWCVTYPAPLVAASAMSCRKSCRRKSIFSLPRTCPYSGVHAPPSTDDRRLHDKHGDSGGQFATISTDVAFMSRTPSRSRGTEATGGGDSGDENLYSGVTTTWNKPGPLFSRARGFTACAAPTTNARSYASFSPASSERA